VPAAIRRPASLAPIGAFDMPFLVPTR